MHTGSDSNVITLSTSSLLLLLLLLLRLLLLLLHIDRPMSDSNSLIDEPAICSRHVVTLIEYVGEPASSHRHCHGLGTREDAAVGHGDHCVRICEQGADRRMRGKAGRERTRGTLRQNQGKDERSRRNLLDLGCGRCSSSSRRDDVIVDVVIVVVTVG